MPIRVLPQTLINQIAAGEVVVGMASVVKELVENSIDAGSTRIEVILGEDARNVEIRDDGCGMNREDAELCLQRHATSKIRTTDDLFNLSTRGFRGEAIPSIASVSRMEIQTRERDALSGTRAVVEGGRIERLEAFGCPPGTRIQIRDLFFNTPARRKFLKSPVGELNTALATITRQAIAEHTIGFRVVRGDREVMELPSGQTLADRFRAILGSEVDGELIPIGHERPGARLYGFLAPPSSARGDRRSQFLFVNRRPFSARSLTAAFEQACRGYIMVRRFPVYCLFIDVPPGDVDINVHPTKEEVRFRDERLVAGAVYRAVEAGLSGSPVLIGDMQLGDQEPRDDDAPPPAAPSAAPPPPPPAFFTSPEELVRRAFDRKQERAASQPDLLVEAARQQPAPAPPPAREEVPARPSRLAPAREKDGSVVSAGGSERPDNDFWARDFEPEPLGQIAQTYILARYGEDLLIIDQHAAHERLVYLEFRRRRRSFDSQALFIPLTIELEAAQSEMMRELVPTLAGLGIEVEPFGPRTWAVQALPADLADFDPVPMILDLVADLGEARRMNALDELRDRILIRAACHSAIRAGMSLTIEKMRELLRQMRAERLSLTCPHGRPTIVRLSKGELDRQFKRIV